MNFIPVTIAAGASLSDIADLLLGAVVGFYTPAAWTAAGLTLQASRDKTTFVDVYNSDGTEWSITVAANRFIPLAPLELQGVRHLKVRSGTSGVPVNQGAAAVIYVVSRNL